MKNETKIWLTYSEENLASAKVLMESKLFNPCLQNIQQSVEKALKALLIENSVKFRKTHSIWELKNVLSENGISIELDDEECDFLDSIYLPSKYPVISVLPHFEANYEVCEKGISIAENVFASVTEKM